MVCNKFFEFLADGYMLIEGMSKLAKITAAKEIAEGIKGDFYRIQLTPRFTTL